MITVFLPAYNEELALEPIAQKIHAALGSGYRILILDDGSSDRTYEKAKELSVKFPFEILRHEVNRGLGQTMIDGLHHAAKTSAPGDTIVTLDCDDTHDPVYIPKAMQKLSEGYDVVILSRYQKGGGEEGLSGVRSVLSRGAGLFLKLFFPIKGVWEYSCGYRAMRAETLQKAFRIFGDKFVELPHMGFVVTPEILIKFRLMKCRITEIPFVLHYEKKAGASKNKPLKTIGGYFALLWLCWGRSAGVLEK